MELISELLKGLGFSFRVNTEKYIWTPISVRIRYSVFPSGPPSINSFNFNICNSHLFSDKRNLPGSQFQLRYIINISIST